MNRNAFVSALLLVGLVAAPLTPSAGALGEASSLPLSMRLLQSGDLSGFTPKTPDYTSSAAAWAHACAGGAPRVRADGFIAAAGEHLKSPLKGRDAVSLVARFRTRHGAEDDVTIFVRQHRDCSSVDIVVAPVAGIPGARSIDARQSDGEGYDVVFADGVFSYDVGAFTADRTGPPHLADVAAAARRLYHRVHGHPATSTHTP